MVMSSMSDSATVPCSSTGSVEGAISSLTKCTSSSSTEANAAADTKAAVKWPVSRAEESRWSSLLHLLSSFM
jgi:hypothetical protein